MRTRLFNDALIASVLRAYLAVAFRILLRLNMFANKSVKSYIHIISATGYIAQRLLPVHLEKGHQVICMVKDDSRFNAQRFGSVQSINILEADLMDRPNLSQIFEDIDAAYFLVHYMSGKGNFSELEKRSSENFAEALFAIAAKAAHLFERNYKY